MVDDFARYAALKTELESIKGHDASKWIAEYPFALAEAIRGGKREIISNDFPKAIARANAIVADLKAGRDDIWQTKGLQNTKRRNQRPIDVRTGRRERS